MYISGSLKKHLINLNREKTQDFNEKSICMDNYLFSYDGHFTASTSKMFEIYKLQKNLIEGLYAQIILFAKENYGSSIKDEITFLATKLKNCDLKFSLIALETLKKLLTKSDLGNPYLKIKEFFNLLSFLNDNRNSLKQIDIEIICNLFFQNFSYTKDDILKTKMALFNIDERTLTIEQLSIYKMGEFIAPERLKNISSDLNNKQNLAKIISYLLLTEQNDISKIDDAQTLEAKSLLKLIKKQVKF